MQNAQVSRVKFILLVFLHFKGDYIMTYSAKYVVGTPEFIDQGYKTQKRIVKYGHEWEKTLDCCKHLDTGDKIVVVTFAAIGGGIGAGAGAAVGGIGALPGAAIGVVGGAAVGLMIVQACNKAKEKD